MIKADNTRQNCFIACDETKQKSGQCSCINRFDNVMSKETNCHKCVHSRSNSDNNSAHIHCRLYWSYFIKDKPSHPKGSQHGIDNGWYDFPYNYDPVWMIDSCAHFEKKVTLTAQL